MNPYFYSDTISEFITFSTHDIFGTISQNSDFPDEPTQKEAWTQEIKILKEVLKDQEDKIFFEYSILQLPLLKLLKSPATHGANGRKFLLNEVYCLNKENENKKASYYSPVFR